MNVLSLFDGISGARVALDRAGVRVNNYYASEVDKYAIQVAMRNYPDTVQLGDITKWREWNIDFSSTGLIVAGSPCQGFSFAGKQLNFDDPRSKLFFEFARILKEVRLSNPDVKFLLENVKMKKEYQNVITDILGVEPVQINSALVSAQNRKRLYWTNIPDVIQPDNKKIFLKDIVFDDAIFTYLRPRGNNTGGIRSLDGKVGSVTSSSFEHNVFPVCMHNLYGGFGEKEHRTFIDKSPAIRTSAGGGHIPSLLHSEKALEYMSREVKDGRTHWDFKHYSDIRDQKSSAVVANFFKGVPYNVLKDWNCIRKFHPVECERLQTYPDGYTEGLSATQRYKCLGNSFTVDVITYILKGLK